MPAGTLETLAVNEISRLSACESQASVLAPGGDLFGICVYTYVRGRRFPVPLAVAGGNSSFLPPGSNRAAGVMVGEPPKTGPEPGFTSLSAKHWGFSLPSLSKLANLDSSLCQLEMEATGAGWLPEIYR